MHALAIFKPGPKSFVIKLALGYIIIVFVWSFFQVTEELNEFDKGYLPTEHHEEKLKVIELTLNQTKFSYSLRFHFL